MLSCYLKDNQNGYNKKSKGRTPWNGFLSLSFFSAIALVLIIARPKKPEGAATEDRAALPNYSNYITQALQFLEFYETLPQNPSLSSRPPGLALPLETRTLAGPLAPI